MPIYRQFDTKTQQYALTALRMTVTADGDCFILRH